MKGIGWNLKVREFVVGDKVIVHKDIEYQGYRIAGKIGTVVDTHSYIIVEIELGRDQDYYPIIHKFKMLRYEIEHVAQNEKE